MEKKVFIISSSPRIKGNSDILCDELSRGAADAGNQCEKINLQKADIHPCLGCDVCQENGGDCVQKDSMAKIVEKMMQADVLVFATPIYFYNMDARLKMLMDRTYCCYQSLSSKKAVLIAACAASEESAFDITVSGYQGYLSCLDQVSDAGMVLAHGVWEKGAVKSSRFMQQAYELGKTL